MWDNKKPRDVSVLDLGTRLGTQPLFSLCRGGQMSQLPSRSYSVQSLCWAYRQGKHSLLAEFFIRVCSRKVTAASVSVRSYLHLGRMLAPWSGDLRTVGVYCSSPIHHLHCSECRDWPYSACYRLHPCQVRLAATYWRLKAVSSRWSRSLSQSAWPRILN